ncbi:MAG: aminoacyl-tRNA deacylase [Chloroflexota bacterium]
MSCRERIEAFLRDNQASYQVQHHPVAYTAQETAAAEHIPGKTLAKTVMVFADNNLAMLVLDATHQIDLAKAASAIGAGQVRLAREEEFSGSFPDCEVGAMPPFGNLYGIPVYVDKALTADESIVFESGVHTETMSMKYADYERVVKPKVCEFARRW